MSTDLTSSISTWQLASTNGSFEESMAALDAIVSLLDGGELTLDQSLDLFELGAQLSFRAQQLLERAELRIEIIQQSLGTESGSEPPF